ncbi:MAG: hypothetical protein A2381_04565 [Bdellovibrionales bacterium RIFOXYB1_FULL_37_110]|nr:MAG: hypothetical protein A2417_16145 [Bdellovibrionales bacterium RIFOXYC1_FULL_37_79]OFZ57440.1 MAG: hypothetical protein A2381_04565 [Bdellovibrionales bacterium RIFOXYB1_FULL_37_110]OFZ64532.1 MAG: hypothetical protein A2577_13670 [Bdellovibrionales bacterium RIFOXYD1_FULL_36_51]
MNKLFYGLCFIWIIWVQSLYANEQVAKVILLKGKVTEFRPSINKTFLLANDSWVLRNSILETDKGSVVKLIFVDQSRVTLGPNSKLEIGKFAQNEAGILSVMKGKLKATVLKNALDSGDKNKLYIKTETAAMGVRGTEFMVMYNHNIQKTSVLTFSGEVMMSQIPKEMGLRLPSAQLSLLLEKDKAVSIKHGQYAGTNEMGRPNIPIKINPAQFQTLKGASLFEESRQIASEVKSYQSKIPPNLDAKTFINQNSELEQSMKNVLGETKFEDIDKTVRQTIDNEKKDASLVPAEGFYDPDTKEFAPMAGGFIDIEKGVYVAPPEDSEYDSNTDTYIVPTSHGTYDEASGGFKPPSGYQMNEDGTIQYIGQGQPEVKIITDGGTKNEIMINVPKEPIFTNDPLSGSIPLPPEITTSIVTNTTVQNSISLLKISVRVLP